MSCSYQPTINTNAIARQRAARVAQGRILRDEARAQRIKTHANAPSFWDNIDTSGGVDACHPWTGARRWNNMDPTVGWRYEYAVFENYEGASSYHAQRVLCFAFFGHNVPRDLDVSPICGDHLCCNIRHMAITPHGCGQAKAIPVAEYAAQHWTADAKG